MTTTPNYLNTHIVLLFIADAYLEGICNANTTSGCLAENAECKDSVCYCIMEYTNINGTCKAGELDHQSKSLTASAL